MYIDASLFGIIHHDIATFNITLFNNNRFKAYICVAYLGFIRSPPHLMFHSVAVSLEVYLPLVQLYDCII